MTLDMNKANTSSNAAGYSTENANTIITTDSITTIDGRTLTVYHYADGTTDKDMLNIRGYIKDQDGKLLCKSFGYSPDVLANDFANLNALVSPIVTDQTRFYKSYEGTILRVWNDGLSWWLSTHRKINAWHSKWGSSINYGSMFCTALSKIYASEETTSELIFNVWTKGLNRNKVYVIMMRSYKANRKVCDTTDEPLLYCIGSFDRNKDFEFSNDNVETRLDSPAEITDINTPEDLIQRVVALDPRDCQGIVLMNPDSTSAKVINLEYARLDALRGNVPNVIHRYVQLRWTSQIEDYKQLYPEHKPKFDHWERIMGNIVAAVMRKYIERFVHKRQVRLPEEQYNLMVALHDLYMQQLRHINARASEEHIWYILSTWSERQVNVLYNRFNNRKNAAKHNQQDQTDNQSA